MGKLFEDDLLHAVGGGVLTDDGNGPGDILSRRPEYLAKNGIPLVFGLGLRIVDDELDVDLGVLVAGGLFGLGCAALHLLLVHFRRFRDLNAFDKAGEDDAIELDPLILDKNHGVALLSSCQARLGVQVLAAVDVIFDLFHQSGQ